MNEWIHFEGLVRYKLTPPWNIRLKSFPPQGQRGRSLSVSFLALSGPELIASSAAAATATAEAMAWSLKCLLFARSPSNGCLSQFSAYEALKFRLKYRVNLS